MKDELPEAWFVVDDNIVNSLQVGKERGKSIGSDVKISSSRQLGNVSLNAQVGITAPQKLEPSWQRVYPVVTALKWEGQK